jgi:dTDP-4-dehydrorhamnose reductase
MKATILLTGKTGQVGFELNRRLPAVAKVVALERDQLDLLDPKSIRRGIQTHRPQIFVNAAGYTAVDAAERYEQTARAINATAVGIIAEEMKKIGGTVIHYSTDYVFDGTKNAPYLEIDTPNPINAYGKTKLEGEVAIRSSGVSHLILRTSWVYATRGRNFMLNILRLATEREELSVVGDQTGAPTCASDVAEVTVQILRDLLAGAAGVKFFDVGDTYHATAAGQTTWCDFAERILGFAREATKPLPWLTEATQGSRLSAKRVVSISTTQYGSPTRRPAYSVLSNERLNQTFGISLPHWADRLAASFAEI